MQMQTSATKRLCGWKNSNIPLQRLKKEIEIGGDSDSATNLTQTLLHTRKN